MAYLVPLESNPDVMNNLLAKCGVPKNVKVVDVFSLDPDMLAFVPQPVAALLLLYPYNKKYDDYKTKQEEEIKAKGQTISPKLFFLKQYLSNTCGTIALIHSVANMEELKLDDGFLKNFLEKAKNLDPNERGLLLQSDNEIVDIHSEIAAQGQTAPADESEPVLYHFVAFVEKEGNLYELDGRKSFPINHGPSSPSTFLEDAAKLCRDYMKIDPDNATFCPNDGESAHLINGTPKKGLTVLSAAIFIVGEMAGSGVLALPRAAVDAGWMGIVLVIVFCINAGYGGSRLGACWEILEERYEDYRKPVRNPYATIAYRAIGSWGGRLVSGCIQFTLFGAGTVYLLLAAQIIQDLLEHIFPSIGLCVWFLILGFVFTPFMWLGSPKDFPFVGVGALATTAVSCVLIFITMVQDGQAAIEPPPRKVHDFHDFFLSFGTILFAFGGASTFPTIQNDMIRKDKFWQSVTMAFGTVMLVYLPITIGGYLVYGELVQTNVILSLTESPLIVIANILMAIHLVLAFLIVINPVCQEIEETFQVPHEFGTKRCIVRSGIMLTMIIVGETIPRFGKILSLVGGSTITLLTFVFPCLFYMILCNQRRPNWPERHIPLYLKIYLWELILIGLCGGAASTYNALVEIISPESLTFPCFWAQNS